MRLMGRLFAQPVERSIQPMIRLMDDPPPQPLVAWDRNRPVDLLRHALEERDAVVGLVDDDHLARRLLAQVECGEHAWKEEDRVASGTEERARDPAVRVGSFAEVRDLPLDAGQVLEVGGRSEEERVDACVLEPLGETPLAGGVVEHAPDAS